MINAFEIGISLNVILGGLEKIQQLAAEFTKVQGMANEVAAQIERMGGVLNTTFASAATSSTEFEGALERNLATMRAMSSEAVTMRTNMRAITPGLGGGGDRRGGRRDDGRPEREQERAQSQLTSMTGLGALIGAAAIRDVWHAVVPLGNEITRMRLLGESPQSIADAREKAYQTTRVVPGMDTAQAMEVNRKASTLFGSIPPDLLQSLATNAKAIEMTTGESSNAVLQSMFRGIEASQRLTTGGKFDPERVKREADLFASGTILAGGDIKAQALMHTQVYSSAAQRFQRPEESVALGVTATERYGQKAGNYLQSLNNMFEQGGIALHGRGASIAARAGLLDLSKIGMTPDILGALKGGKGGAIPLTAQTIALDPHKGEMENLKFVADRLRAIMPQLNMKPTDENFQKLVTEIFPKEVARVFADLNSESGRAGYQRNLDRVGQMQGVDRLAILRQDPKLAMDDFLKSLQTLVQELVNLSEALSFIQGITSGVKGITDFVHTFPHLTSIIVGISKDLAIAWAGIRVLKAAETAMGVKATGAAAAAAVVSKTVTPVSEVGVMHVTTMHVGTMAGAVPGATPSKSGAAGAAGGTAAGVAGGAAAGGLLARGGAALGRIGRVGLWAYLLGDVAKSLSDELGTGLPEGIKDTIKNSINGAEIGAALASAIPGGTIMGAIAGAISGALAKPIMEGVEQGAKNMQSMFVDDYGRQIPSLSLGAPVHQGASAPPDRRHEDYETMPPRTPLPETTVTARRDPPMPRVIPHVRPPQFTGFRHAPAHVGDTGPVRPIPMPATPRFSVPGQLPATVPESSTRLGPPLPTTGITSPAVTRSPVPSGIASPVVGQTLPAQIVSPTAGQTQVPAIYVTTLYVGNMQGGLQNVPTGATTGTSPGTSSATGDTGRAIPHRVIGGLHGGGGGGAHNLGGPVTPFSAPGAFAQKAPAVMQRLMSDLHITKAQAAGVVGNLGLESGGFTKFHEMGKPENQGGIGWGQWTGPRRKEFEAWTTAHGLDPRSDTANLGFLEHELTHGESKSLAALRQTSTVGQATQSFMTNFERPGVPALGSRLDYANQAFGMPFSQPIELASSAPVNMQPVMPPPNTNHYNAQFDIHLDNEVLSSHVFNNMFDSNPAGAAGPTAYDKTMAPWAPGTSITR